MSEGAGEAPVLPGAVTELVARFEAAHPGCGITIWQACEAGWRRLRPADGEVERRPRRGGERVPIPDTSPPLVLEAAGGAVARGTLEFLADALGRVWAYEREASSGARELSERYEEINLLYSISEILGSVLSLEVASARILEEVADVMNARRASLWIHDGGRMLELAAAFGEEGLSGPIPVDDDRSVTARVFRERQPLNLEAGARLPDGSRLDPAPRASDAFLSVPMNYTPPGGEPRTVGVITLVGRRGDTPFSAGDTRLLTAIASQVGAALETHRLVRESLRRERLVRELELAHDLQLKLLPDAADFDGAADVAVRCVPADSVGGDFYHLFRLSGGRLGAMIGDVSGHGFPAALMMALTLSAAAIYAQEAGPPGEVLRRVHRALIAELETTEMYLTLFYGVLDPAAGKLIYSSAGHPHAFRVPADGAAVRLTPTDLPLGTRPQEQYTDVEVPWVPGEELLLLFTDGLAEAFAGRSGSGGEARLVAEVERIRARRPQQILERLFASVKPIRFGVPPDDRTAVLVRV